jgi:hypothetical protein
MIRPKRARWGGGGAVELVSVWVGLKLGVSEHMKKERGIEVANGK